MMWNQKMTLGEAKEMVEKNLATLCDKVLELTKGEIDIEVIKNHIEVSKGTLGVNLFFKMNNSSLEFDEDTYAYLKLKRQETFLSPDVYLLIAFMQIHPETKVIGEIVKGDRELSESELTPLNKTLLYILPKIRENCGYGEPIKVPDDFNISEAAFFSAKHHRPDDSKPDIDVGIESDGTEWGPVEEVDDEDEDDEPLFDFTKIETVRGFIQAISTPALQRISLKVRASNDVLDIYKYVRGEADVVSSRITTVKEIMNSQPEDKVSDDVRKYMNGVISSIAEPCVQNFVLTALVMFSDVFGEYAEEIQAASQLGDSTTLNTLIENAKDLFSEKTLDNLRKYVTIVMIEKALKEGEQIWR